MSNKLFNGDSFCVMPWVHLNIDMNGDVKACCLVSKPFGNINSNSIDEIWNGDEINEFRINLLNNVKDERCNYCYLRESSGAHSLRQTSNVKYLSHFLNTSSIEKTIDGEKANPPIYWDIRLSNICNFRCRTCYHGASSRWFDEAVKLGETVSSKPIIKAVEKLDEFYDQLEELVECVEEIYFAGGEPLIMDEHYKILELLQNKKNFNTHLRYNTNFSQFKYRDIHVFDIWNKFNQVFVVASLDGWGKRGEFLRKEQKWNDVLMNRELMKRICPNVNFAVSVTVSVFNIFHLADFHKELVSAGVIPVEGFIIENLLQTPGYYSIQILPLESKLKIKEKIEKHIEWVDSQANENFNKDHFIVQFNNCINYLFADDLSENITQFVSRCKKLDELRAEKTIDVFPELEFLLGK